MLNDWIDFVCDINIILAIFIRLFRHDQNYSESESVAILKFVFPQQMFISPILRFFQSNQLIFIFNQ